MRINCKQLLIKDVCCSSIFLFCGRHSCRKVKKFFLMTDRHMIWMRWEKNSEIKVKFINTLVLVTNLLISFCNSNIDDIHSPIPSISIFPHFFNIIFDVFKLIKIIKFSIFPNHNCGVTAFGQRTIGQLVYGQVINCKKKILEKKRKKFSVLTTKTYFSLFKFSPI